MNKKVYILTYDREEGADNIAFHNKLIKLPEVLNWFHYVKSSYIIVSNVQNASTLSSKIQKFIPSSNFFVMELNPVNSNGLLVPKAWDWIKKYS
jgi:hypothetical protein